MGLSQDGPHPQVPELGFLQLGKILLHYGELDFSARDFLRQRFILDLLTELDDVDVTRNLVGQLDQRSVVGGFLWKIHCAPC